MFDGNTKNYGIAMFSIPENVNTDGASVDSLKISGEMDTIIRRGGQIWPFSKPTRRREENDSPGCLCVAERSRVEVQHSLRNGPSNVGKAGDNPKLPLE